MKCPYYYGGYSNHCSCGGFPPSPWRDVREELPEDLKCDLDDAIRCLVVLEGEKQFRVGRYNWGKWHVEGCLGITVVYWYNHIIPDPPIDKTVKE